VPGDGKQRCCDWTIGGTGIAASGQFLFGDEANLTPKIPLYSYLGLHTSYQLTNNLQLFSPKNLLANPVCSDVSPWHFVQAGRRMGGRGARCRCGLA
jgi:hypothetical protein